MASRLADPVRLGARRRRRSGSTGMGGGIPSGCWLLQTGGPGHGRRAAVSGAVEGRRKYRVSRRLGENPG